GRYAAATARLLRESGVRFVLEVWNEPHNFVLRRQLGGPWHGGPPCPWLDHYVKMVTEAVQQVKAFDPTIKVLSDEDCTIIHYRLLEAGLPRELDGFAFHPYLSRTVMKPELTKEGRGAAWEVPFTLADEDHSFRSMVRRLRQQGEAKLGRTPELWITEFGCPVREDVRENVTFELGSGTEEEVAAILVRAFIGAQAAGVQVMTWFSFWDGPDGPMGLLTRDGLKRKPYEAFRTMSQQLGEYTLVRQVAGSRHPTTGVQAYLFRKGRDWKLVTWAIDGPTCKLALAGALREAQATDVLGQAVQAPNGAAGMRQLELGTSPLYLSGVRGEESVEECFGEGKSLSTSGASQTDGAMFAGAQTRLSEAVRQQWRRQICGNFFVPEPPPALEATTYRRFAPAPGVRAEGLTYRTQFGLSVPAILYLPDPLPAGKIPAFIVVNGHGGDKYSWYAWYTGILFARGGAAVLTYDQVGEGERNSLHRSGTRAHDKIQGDALLARHLAGLMITDVRQAVSYLGQRAEVDERRIAAGGYSMGSFVLALAGAVEPRLRACVLVGGGNLDGPDGYWDTSKPMCQGLPYKSLAFLGDRPAALYALHAARGPTLIFNGPGDTVVAMPNSGPPFFQALRERVARLHGSTKGLFETGFAPKDASHRPYFLTRPVVQWLDRQIDFPNWTEESLRSLPETRIGTWAEQTGVSLDRSYATEEREGGTPALGQDVPGYTPEMLDVLPRDEWESRKSDFVLETWLEAVQKNIANLRRGE
ncbi:MAG: hypothetical protein MUC88_25010, partial [Planctomycetes bacterium]|nr:hypothetical protein [Planctomycetota bacterium]